MAPPAAADVVVAPKRQVRRNLPHNFVPAVPLKFSRPSRPSAPAKSAVPVETPPTPVTQHDADPEPEPQEQEQHPEQKHADNPLSIGTPSQEPLTPESKSSGLGAQGQTPEDRSVFAPEEPVSVFSESAETPLIEAQTSIKPEDQEVARKLAQSHAQSLARSNMNNTNGDHKRSELPPPFYPSQSSADTTARPSSSRKPNHISRPSVDGIVFGATQESPVGASTPQEIDQDNYTIRQPVPRQPPGFLQPDFARPFYPGHSHHPAGNPAPWVPPTVSAAPLDGPYQNGNFQAPHFPLPGIYNGIRQDRLSPGAVPVGMNGIGRSHSQSPAKPQFHSPLPTSEHGDDHNSAFRNGNVPRPFVPQPKYDAGFELGEYLSHRLGNPEFADFILCVRSAESVLLQLPVHGIIVARSQPIASEIHRIRSSPSKHDSILPQIDLFTHDNSVTPDSVTEAIKVLYGGPLFPVERIVYGLRPFHVEDDQGQNTQEARKRMAQAISYTATGRLFQLPSVQKQGNDMIRALLRWDTIEQAAGYTLSRSVYARAREDPNQEAPTQEEYEATQLFERDCIDFIAFNTPKSFKLDVIAPELQYFPRLPLVHESRSATHNPRLSRIRFGDVPAEEDIKSDYISRVLSSILLSLPLTLLEGLLKHQALLGQFGPSAAERLLQEVIGERENRRRKVLSNGLISQSNGFSRRLVDNVFHEEHSHGRALLEQRERNHV